MKQEKVVITGLGIYSPIGKSIDELYMSLLQAKSGIGEIPELNFEGFRNTKFGAVTSIDETESHTGLRSNHLLMHSVKQAITDSGICNSKIDGKRVAISIGTSIGGFGGFVEWLFLDQGYERGGKTLNSMIKLNRDETILNIPPILLATEVAKKYKFSGGISASTTACSAGGNSIAMAADTILSGNADVVVAGSVDPLTEMTFMGFNSLMVIAKDTIKPLDQNRGGLIIGEGSGCLILEKESHAKQRGAKIYAELAGYALSNDAYHPTQPHPNGDGAVIAMTKALQAANLNSEDISYINVHGTGTQHNDTTELKGLVRVFGDNLKEIPISSSKSMIGHTLGSAGTIEAIITDPCVDVLFIMPEWRNRGMLCNRGK